jgi:hypothetical protein
MQRVHVARARLGSGRRVEGGAHQTVRSASARSFRPTGSVACSKRASALLRVVVRRVRAWWSW